MENLISNIENLKIHDASSVHGIVANASSYSLLIGDPSSAFAHETEIGLPVDINSMLVNLTPNLLLKDSSDGDFECYSKGEMDDLLTGRLYVPENEGFAGQVLTKGFNNTHDWVTPAISGEEFITVELDVSSGSGSASGVEVTVSIEGGETYSYITDASGMCNFSIECGAMYNVSCGGIDGYVTPQTVSYRSTLANRYINLTYVEQTLLEHVKVYCWYDNIGTGRATAISVTNLGVTTSYALVNNVCEFDIPLNSQYTIKYQSVTGYDKPASVVVTASQTSRSITAYYISTVTQLAWVKTDGTIVGFTELGTLQESEVFGVRIQTSALSGSLSGNCSYVIPYDYLIGISSIGNKIWCTSNVQFNCIGNYVSEGAALTDDGTNFDGKANTLAVKSEALDRGLTVPAFDTVLGMSFTIGGVARQCFLGSYAQIKAFRTNRDNINTMLNNVFGKTAIDIASGSWWTSTQYSAQDAVHLNDGGFGNGYKYRSRQVLPLLAY